jgi:hypothetical protein
MLDFLDFTSDTPSRSPWFDSQGATGERGVLTATDETSTDVNFNIKDNPHMTATESMTCTHEGQTDAVDVFSIVNIFSLYFAVRTTDSRHNAHTNFTQRGIANWRFDGSGVIGGDGETWSQTGSGTTGDGEFTAVVSGAVVPQTTGASANFELRTQNWQWINIPE